MRFIGIAAAACSLLVGCELLYPGLGSEDAFPSPRATYSSGSAELVVSGEDDQTIQLTRINPGPHVYSDMGTIVTWSGPDGWALRVSVYDVPGLSGGDGGVAEIHRITEGRHLASMDPSRCVVTIEEASDTRLAGTATCRDVTWTDVLDDPMYGFASPSPSGVTFDAEITFLAED